MFQNEMTNYNSMFKNLECNEQTIKKLYFSNILFCIKKVIFV